MTGRPQGAQARTEYIRVRLAPSGMAAVDARCTTLGITRSAYIRMLIRNDLAKKGQK